MYERLLLLKELLAEDGSLWLHSDHRKTHLLRILLDEVFGIRELRERRALEAENRLLRDQLAEEEQERVEQPVGEQSSPVAAPTEEEQQSYPPWIEPPSGPPYLWPQPQYEEVTGEQPIQCPHCGAENVRVWREDQVKEWMWVIVIGACLCFLPGLLLLLCLKKQNHHWCPDCNMRWTSKVG